MGPEAHCNSPPPSQRVRTHNDMLKLRECSRGVLVATPSLLAQVLPLRWEDLHYNVHPALHAYQYYARDRG
jgi:hypothetical protein